LRPALAGRSPPRQVRTRATRARFIAAAAIAATSCSVGAGLAGARRPGLPLDFRVVKEGTPCGRRDRRHAEYARGRRFPAAGDQPAGRSAVPIQFISSHSRRATRFRRAFQRSLIVPCTTD
jgi:hypothetical protein